LCYIPVKAKITGNLETEMPIILHGTVDGNIKCASKLTIGVTGVVNGNIEATELKLKGRVHGNCFVTFDATIGKEAVIKGSIDASPLILQEGAQIIKEDQIKNKASEEQDLKVKTTSEKVKETPAPVIEREKDSEISRWF
jgi:cytoskeletal protein CcmA (bactofilin family)